MSDSFARAVALHRARGLGEIRPAAAAPRPAAPTSASGEVIAVDFAPRRIDRAVGQV